MGHDHASRGLARDLQQPDLGVLRLPVELRIELSRRAVEGYPHEVCGLLVGTNGSSGADVRRIVSARNLAVKRLADRYKLDPDDFLAADASARAEGLEIVGVWHTHPDHPARPSRTDLEAAWEGYSYLILSVRHEGVADVTSWLLDSGRFVEQTIEEVRR